jgi:hypothetical protein
MVGCLSQLHFFGVFNFNLHKLEPEWCSHRLNYFDQKIGRCLLGKITVISHERGGPENGIGEVDVQYAESIVTELKSVR